VQEYEAEQQAVDTSGLTGLDSLKHLLEDNGCLNLDSDSLTL
jgi:hypothetical protein